MSSLSQERVETALRQWTRGVLALLVLAGLVQLILWVLGVPVGEFR